MATPIKLLPGEVDVTDQFTQANSGIKLNPGEVDVTNQYISETPKPEETTILGEIPKGLKAGLQQVKGMGYGLGALAGTATGADSLTQWGAEGLADVEANTPKPAVASYSDIKDISDLGKYVSYGVSSNLPNMALSFTGGGIGAVVGKKLLTNVAEHAVKKAITAGASKEVALLAGKKIIDQAIKSGAMAGGATASIGMEAGSIAGDQLTETGKVSPGMAIAGAIPAGLLDVVPEWYLAKRLGWIGKGAVDFQGNRLVRASKVAGQQFAMEAPTEAMQSVIERAAVPGKSISNADAWDEYINSFILGGLTGATVGGGAGVFTKAAKEDPKQSATLINNLATGGDLKTIETADLDAVIKQAESINSPEPDLVKSVEILKAEKAARQQVSDVPDFQPSEKSPDEQFKNFQTDVMSGKITIQQAFEQKKSILSVAPQFEDDINKTIIEAEGNKLFAAPVVAPAVNPEIEELKASIAYRAHVLDENIQYKDTPDYKKIEASYQEDVARLAELTKPAEEIQPLSSVKTSPVTPVKDTPEKIVEPAATSEADDWKAIIEKARKGDQDEQAKLKNFGLSWDGNKPKYRLTGPVEITKVLNNEVVESDRGHGVTDVTDNPEYANVSPDSNHRITFKQSDRLDSDVSRDIRIKNEKAGEYHLVGGYSLQDVQKIEKKNKEGGWEVVYDIKETITKQPPAAKPQAQGARSLGARPVVIDQAPAAAAPKSETTVTVKRQGKMGDMLSSGEVVLTSSGRETTPFPKITTGTNQKTSGTSKRVDSWLRENAIAEAKARGDEWNARQFESENPKNIPPASKDSMEEYLFWQQPKVVPSILNPLTAPLPKPPGAGKLEATENETRQEKLSLTNIANAIRTPPPIVKDGFVRVYRGESSDSNDPQRHDSGRFWTRSLNEASSYGDRLWYLDIPADQAGEPGDVLLANHELERTGAKLLDHGYYDIPEKIRDKVFGLLEDGKKAEAIALIKHEDSISGKVEAAGAVKEPWEMTREEWRIHEQRGTWTDFRNDAIDRALAEYNSLEAKKRKIEQDIKSLDPQITNLNTLPIMDQAIIKNKLKGMVTASVSDRKSTMGALADLVKTNATFQTATRHRNPAVRELAKAWRDVAAKLQAASMMLSELQSHEGHIKYAIEQGLPIPPEVLKDYPDLQPKAEAKTNPFETDITGKEVNVNNEKREAIINRYIEVHKARGEKNVDRRKIAEGYIKAIEEKDVERLRGIMNGINPEVNKLFTAITGLPAKTQKEADASIRSLNPERWDAWQKETAEKQKNEETERATAVRKQGLDLLLNVQVKHDGAVMTYREHYDKAIAAGHTSIEEEKKGVASVYRLVNPQTQEFYTVKKKIVADYLKGRIEELKSEQKPEAPKPDAKSQEFAEKWNQMGYAGRQDIAQASVYGKQRAVVHRISGSKWAEISEGERKEILKAVEQKTEAPRPEVEKPLTEDDLRSLTYDSIVAYEATKGVGNLKEFTYKRGKYKAINKKDGREHNYVVQIRNDGQILVTDKNVTEDQINKDLLADWEKVPEHIKTIINREWPDLNQTQKNSLAIVMKGDGKLSPTGMVVISGGRVVRRALELFPDAEGKSLDYLASKLREFAQASLSPKSENQKSDLSSKSTGDLIKDMFAIINDHIGERGSISTKEVDETLYQKLKPYLAEIASRAKAKALDARAYLFGAVDSMPEGKAKSIYETAANRYIDEGNAVDTVPEKDYNITKEGEKNEPQSDGSTGAGTLESDESGNLPADGRGQGTRRGKRGSSQADNEGNQDLDAGGLDGSGSVAGKSSPIHLQDSGTDGEVLPAESSAVDETPASEPRTIQLSGINPGNYRITEEDDIGSGTRGQKIDRNIAAIRLIKKLDQEHRYPTKEEQSVLAKYVGWGGIKNVFDETSNKPQDQRAYADLKELLTKEEFFEARQSVLNAHYTSPQVIRSIYKIMSHFGFTGGNILEPTYGAGNFIGLMPEDMAASSKWYGSELDPITAKIGQYLYPDSQLIHSGFQNAEFPYGKFDAEIGNPPFGDVRISDTRKERAEINRMKIHNYVISKSGLHLRPGGISANVITTRFLDTADPEARDFLAKQFKFLGAIRLPNDAFAKNAGTEVTTDLVFFQRLMPGEKPDMSADWLTTGATITNKDGEKITLNKYFAERPELMLGEPSMKGTMYGGAWKEGGKGEFTLNKREGVDIEEAIDKVIRESFFDLKDVAKNNNDKLDAAALSLIPNKEDVAVGGFFMDKDNIFMREDNDEYGNPTYTRLTPKTKWTEKQLLGETRYLRIKGMLELRAKAYELVNAERFDLGNIEHLRKQLNFLYDNFVKNYGFINESSNFSLMSDDIKIEFGLEIDFKKEITKAKAKSLGVKPSPASAEKATLLKERMFYPEKEILYAKDAADGYNISLFQKGKLDIDYIAKLTGTAKESVIADLSKDGLIYQDPDTKEWIQEDEYLSGNVKAKYKKVEGKEGFEKNAKDLKKVFPADVPTEGIFANPGATWIPEKVYEQFGHFIGIENPSVSIYRNNGQFSMRSSGQRQNDINVAWLNSYYSLSDIFNAVANNKVLIAWDGTGDDRTQNKEQTAELATIVQGVRSTFSDWIFADDARASELTKIYNATQNTHAKRKNDGTHLHTVGASPAVILRNTQRDAAWRIIQSKRVLLDHCVGAGKTYTIITGVQERVRMGLTRKAMIAVPNHLVGQWAADYMRLYPGARILAATKKDFSKPNRRRLFARIATGKYDAIIVGHSSFGFIPLETESLTNLMMEEIAQLEAAHAQADADGNKRLVKTLANRIAKKREKINELLGRPRDNVTTFEAMGIDHLVVDESHEFKNLEYSSAMQNITGMGNPMGSKRAFDMYAKIRWLTAQKDYALNFATGTPISNSLVEMYALLRYMNRDALYARGIDAFDSWANTYASIEPRIEYTASQKLKQRTVMATFNNLPELLQLYEEFADIVTMPDLKRIYAEQIRERNARTGGNESEDFPVPKVKDGGRTLDVADPSQEQVEYVDYLVARAERMEELGRQNDPKVDNHLWIMSDARKMALDIRLVDPTAKESPNNKINRATKRIKEIYDRTEKDKGAQLVFCDLSTPSGSAQKNAAVFIREALKKAHLETDARTKAILDSLSTYQEKWGYIRNRLEAEIEAISDHSQAETEQYMKRREEIEDYLEKVTDDITSDLTTADTGFSVYDEMKSKLIMMGIPEGEVKFIHDANTEQQKEDLFAMVNSGQVRVLLGSSQKMGAGMNVQERLVALHHMDAPWRPSDVEQREGRLVRQGNKLYSINPAGFKVEIKAYSTSNTFDAVMWQILARKGGMLDDFRSGRRTVEEVSMDGANYSEFMAETTGNPAFKEKFKLEGDIKALRAIKNRTTTRLRSSQQSIDYNKDARIKSQSEIEKRDKIINDLKGQSTFTFEGKQYKDNAKDLVAKEANEITEYNARVNKEYNAAFDAAINKAFEDKYNNTGWKGAWIKPEFPWGVDKSSREWKAYEEARATYELLMETEDAKKILAEVVKGIKKPTNKHFHSTKLAKSDKSGVIAAALKMVDEINALDDGESFTYQLGNTEIEIKKTESGWTNNVKVEDRTRLWDYVVTADGMFLDRLKEDKDFDERNIWNLLNVESINNRMTGHRRDAANYIERMDRSDEVSKHTLESLKFKDDEKLQRMEARYQEVLVEVQDAEAEISARRAATGNKYIQNDRPRFPAGVWNPHGDDQAVLNNQSEAGISQIDNVDLDALREQRKEIKEGIENGDYEDDDLIIKFAELARAEALLSQKGDGKIDTAQANLTEAVKGWDEFHEGEEYPYEIKLAQKIIESIRSGQGRLFKGQQYSVQSAGNETVTTPTLAEVQEIFKGQEVTQGADGRIWIKTAGGRFLTITKVDRIQHNEARLKINYGRSALGSGENIAGAYYKAGDEGQIRLVRGRADKWTLAHESVHFMEDIGVLGSLDVAALKGHIKRLARNGKFETVNQEDIGGPEDRANFLADALTKEPTGFLGRIVNKIQDFIDKLVNAFGIRTAGGIARDIRTGKVYDRQGGAGRGLDENYMVAAWHGSPYDFDKFSKDKIGTGEGAQAYGYGHYFAGSKEVAEFYKKKLSGKEDPRVLYEPVKAAKAAKVLQSRIDAMYESYEFKDDLDRVWNKVNDWAQDPTYWDFPTYYLEDAGVKYDDVVPEGKQGRLYQVELAPDEDEYLLWDKPLSEQSEKVKAALKPARTDQFDLNPEDGTDIENGGTAYARISGAFGDSDKAASDYLHSLGIRGIKYLDGSSRPTDVVSKQMQSVYDKFNGDIEKAVDHLMKYVHETPKEKEKIRKMYVDKFNRGYNYNYVIFSDEDVDIIEKYSIRKSQDPPTSKDPKVLNLYLKDETDAIVQTIMNKLQPQHMTWLETMLKSPEWFSHPQIQNIVKLFMRDRNEIYHETFNDLNMADDIDAPENTVTEAAKALKNKGLSLADRIAGKVSPEYKRLQEIIDEGDTTWQRNTSRPLAEQIKEFEDHIRKQGASEDTIRVWKLYRQSFDKALDLQTEQLRKMISDIIEEANFRGETPDLGELKQTLKGALAQMEEWRGFYAPRIRESGGWKVQAYKEHGPIKENREYYREHRGSELSANRLALKLKREGWTVYNVGEVERIPETIYQDVNAVATAKLIDTALEKLSKKSNLSNELTVKFNEEILREVSNAIKARGFRSTMIRRSERVIRGFIEDPILRHLQYTNSLSGGISKARVAQMAMKEMLGEQFQGRQIGGIDPVKDPKAFTAAQNYIQEQLRNLDNSDRIIGVAKSIATFKFLGFNIRSLAVNMTAVMTTAPAAIHQYAMGGKGSMFRIMKELGKAGKDYGAVMIGRKLSDSDEQSFIDEVHKKGWDDAQYTREALGEISKTHSRIWSSMMDGSMYLFGKSERWNRGTTMLAAYRLARRNGEGHAAAAELAKNATDKAHGVYGRSTMPMWAQGTNPAAKIGQMMYVYSKFGHNYLQMLYDMGLKKHNIKGAMFAFLSPLVLAGGAAFPFKDVIFSFAGIILRSLFGEDRDPEKWVWDVIRQHLGTDAERIGRHGLTGMAGVDISGSLSIGAGIPKSFLELTGAIGGVATEIKEAAENIGRGKYVKAAEHLLPTGFANPIRALRESGEGVSTRNNRRVWNEKGKPYVPSAGATTARVFGFRSTDQAVLSERTWEGHREQADFNEKKSAIYERYRAWLLGGRNPQEHKEITREVRAFNKSVKDVKGVPRITFESLRRQETGLRKPVKRERAILAN